MAVAPHVVILTSSGLGHVLPVSELAKRLAVHHGFAVTIVTYASLSTPGHASPLASLPVVAWPMFGEQRLNAVMLSSERVGLALWARPPLGKDGAIVPREEVAALTRELMEGEKGGAARRKAGVLRDEAEIASAPGGPQDRALAVVVGMLSLHLKSHGE